MKQPLVNFYDKQYKLKEIEWNKDGFIRKIVFYKGSHTTSIFRNTSVKELRQDKNFDYYLAPNLDILVDSNT